MYAASSREALSEVRTTLEAQLRPGPDGVATTTGDELLSAAEIIASDRNLEALLGDVSLNSADRAAAARSIFGAKVSGATLATLEAVAAANWSRPADVTLGVRDLGIDSLLLAARSTGTLDTVQDELYRLGRIVAGDADLERALADRTRSVTERAGLLGALIDSKVNPITSRLAKVAVSTSGLAPADAISQISERAAAAEGKKVAYVRTAQPLTADQQAKLGASLTRIAGGPVTLHSDVDPSLLGGAVVRIGDERIDGSIAGKFAAARASLT